MNFYTIVISLLRAILISHNFGGPCCSIRNSRNGAILANASKTLNHLLLKQLS